MPRLTLSRIGLPSSFPVLLTNSSGSRADRNTLARRVRSLGLIRTRCVRAAVRVATVGDPFKLRQQCVSFWAVASVLAGLALQLSPMVPAGHAQSALRTHHLSLHGVTASIDPQGRLIATGRTHGDLPGVLTLAVTLDRDGRVIGGEWALDISYIKFGAIDKDGDGDRAEGLVQLGMLKGTVLGGAAKLNSDGRAVSLSSLQLDLNGATNQFHNTQHGKGRLSLAEITGPGAAHGTVSLTF